MEEVSNGRPSGLSSDDGAASVSTLRASIPDAGLPDRTSAEALRIAHEVIKANGWRKTPREIGQTARRILDGLKETGDV